MIKKAALLITIIIIVFAVSFSASADVVSFDFDFDIPTNPKSLTSLSSAEIIDFYENSSFNEVLDKSLCDVIKKPINVNGNDYICDVYIRTFEIEDAVDMPVSQINEAMNNYLNEIFGQISNAINHQFISTITFALGANMSVKYDSKSGVVSQMLISIAFGVGDGVEDIDNIVLNNFVKPTAAKWSGLSDVEKIVKLNEFILNGQFSYDMNLISRKSPVQFIADKKGVCEEYAGLTSLFLTEMGFENIIISGKAVNSLGNSENHAWNMVKLDGTWYHLDILWNGPTDSNGIHLKVTTDYLLKSTNTIKKNHLSFTSFDYYLNLATKDYDFSSLTQDNNANDIDKDIIEPDKPTEPKEETVEPKEPIKPIPTVDKEVTIPKKSPDKSKLNSLITITSGLKKELYINSGLQALSSILENVKKVAGNVNSDEIQIDNAVLLLENAIKNLIMKPDKTSLLSTYVVLVALLENEDKYTEETWKTFITELNNAKNLIDSEEATGQQVDLEQKNLVSALENLEQKIIINDVEEITEEIIQPNATKEIDEAAKFDINNIISDDYKMVIIIGTAGIVFIIIIILIIKRKKKKIY